MQWASLSPLSAAVVYPKIKGKTIENIRKIILMSAHKSFLSDQTCYWVMDPMWK
jgi:hypothetical protein